MGKIRYHCYWYLHIGTRKKVQLTHKKNLVAAGCNTDASPKSLTEEATTTTAILRADLEAHFFSENGAHLAPLSTCALDTGDALRTPFGRREIVAVKSGLR